MFRWIMLCAGFIIVAPCGVYASDVSEGEVSAVEIEAQEAEHEQVEALHLRAMEENEIAEIQGESKREEERSKTEALAAEKEFKSKAESNTSGISNIGGSK